MIRKHKLLEIDSSIQQVCCKITKTGCNCKCPECVGCDTCHDCIECPNLTVNDISLSIYKSGSLNINLQPTIILILPAFTLDCDKVCFFLSVDFFALPPARYTGIVYVQGEKAGLIDMQLGIPYSACEPSVVCVDNSGDDMQPS